MSDWFHCNKCFLRITTAGGTKFLLTNCGHIFCEKCIQSGKQSTCFICRADCTTIPLTSNISPDIQTFFNDVEETAKKFSKVLEFQKSHGKKLFEHILKQNEELQNKYTHAKEYIKKITKQHEALQKDHTRLRELYKRSISSAAPGNRGTPISGESNDLNRFGGHTNDFNKSIMNRTSANNQMYRTPSVYQTPSMISNSSGSRTSMARASAVSGIHPSVAYRPSPSPLNLSGLNFRGARHRPGP